MCSDVCQEMHPLPDDAQAGASSVGPCSSVVEASKESRQLREGEPWVSAGDVPAEVQRLTEQLCRKDEQLDIALGQLWGALDEIEALRNSPGAHIPLVWYKSL